MTFKLGMTVDLFMAYMLIYDLALDARSQRLGRGQTLGVNYLYE